MVRVALSSRKEDTPLWPLYGKSCFFLSFPSQLLPWKSGFPKLCSFTSCRCSVDISKAGVHSPRSSPLYYPRHRQESHSRNVSSSHLLTHPTGPVHFYFKRSIGITIYEIPYSHFFMPAHQKSGPFHLLLYGLLFSWSPVLLFSN